jgi:hypothetical protein
MVWSGFADISYSLNEAIGRQQSAISQRCVGSRELNTVVPRLSYSHLFGQPAATGYHLKTPKRGQGAHCPSRLIKAVEIETQIDWE